MFYSIISSETLHLQIGFALWKPWRHILMFTVGKVVTVY